MTNKCSIFALMACIALVGCAGTNDSKNYVHDTPTVDYVERLDVEMAPHKDSFLHQLAMNYRSYAIYNAKTSGYPDVGELFAQKAISAFSGETPYPETLDSWHVDDEADRFELYTAYNSLIDQLKDDAAEDQPQLAAEAQAKFDCWLSAASSGQNATAEECRYRFNTTMKTLAECSNGQVISPTRVKSENLAPAKTEKYYPETHRLSAMAGSSRTREGVIIVNNVNIPDSLIRPVPVPQQQPMVFHQHIYGGTESVDGGDVSGMNDEFAYSAEIKKECCQNPEGTQCQALGVIDCEADEYVKRDEFIDMMNAMRAELAAINKRLDAIGNGSSDKTVIKVQQIPLEPKQHVMEEIFEIRFDFDKAVIKPEYEDVIRQLAATTQANKNVKVSVVGHTDTSGSSNYNYALGGRRAEAVQKMLIEYGIPSSQIVAVSAGEEDLKVPTPNNTPNAENRRVRVVKEVHYTEQPKPTPIIVEEYSETEGCDE